MKNFFNSVKNKLKRDPGRIDERGFTRLQDAIQENDLKKVLSLIEDGADINDSGLLLHPPLHFALTRDLQNIVIALVEKGADINKPDGDGQTPLHKAVMYGQESIVLLLLKMNADPNAVDGDGRAPLHLVHQKYPGLIDLLAKYHADVNARDADGNTPLLLYLFRGDMTDRLMANGADPNVRNNGGLTAYMHLLLNFKQESPSHRYILQRLQEIPPDTSAVSPNGEPLQHVAARLGLNDFFAGALDFTDLGSTDSRQGNILHTLVETYNMQMIRAVLKKAPELVNMPDALGMTPLGRLAAIHRGSDLNNLFAGLVQVMIEAGADPNARGEGGRTLLHYAVAQDNPRLLKYLLEMHANPNLADDRGIMPLHLALRDRKMKCIDRLLDGGADPDLTDNDGWTLLDRFAENGDRNSSEVQRLIVAGGQYAKQLPLNPQQMRPKEGLDKQPLKRVVRPPKAG